MLSSGPQHGYLLAEQLASSPLMAGTRPDRPGVYRALSAMEQQGLVTHSNTPSDSGPAKRLFLLTAKGEVCLGKWIDTLDEYQNAVRELVAMMRRAVAQVQP